MVHGLDAVAEFLSPALQNVRSFDAQSTHCQLFEHSEAPYKQTTARPFFRRWRSASTDAFELGKLSEALLEMDTKGI